MNRTLTLLITLCTFSGHAFGQEISGTLKFENQYVDVEINITQRNGKLTGNHCIVYGAEGDFIDCADDIESTISGALVKGVFTINIKSEYEVDSVSKVNLRLLPNGDLEWTLVSSPKGISFYPKKAIMKKVT